MARTKQELLASLTKTHMSMSSSLAAFATDALELLDLVPDDVAPPEPEPTPEPEPDAPDHHPIPPVVVGETRITAHLNGDMSSEQIATAISAAQPGTDFRVSGELPMVRFGGLAGIKPAKHKLVAHNEDRTPIRDIRLIGDGADAGIAGLLLHNSLGGFDDIGFYGLKIRPRQDGDRAAVLFEEHFDEEHLQGGLFTMSGCEIWTPKDWTHWDGRRIKQGIVTRCSRYDIQNILFSCVPDEHWIYNHNVMGDSVWRGLRGETEVIALPNGGQAEIGPGRTLWTVQERTEDGLESYGDLVVEDIIGRRACSESVPQGKPGTGGSAITIGGHNGHVKLSQIYVDESMSGGVLAVWAELYGDGTPKGYRDPALESLEIENFRWGRELVSPLFSSRTELRISNTKTVVASGVSGQKPGELQEKMTDPWTDSRMKMNDSHSVDPLTPADVTWS